MSALTGNKQTDLIILQQLTDYELTQVCQVNKNVKELCNDRDFWTIRIINKFPILNGKNDVIRLENYLGLYPRELYIYLTTFPITSIDTFHRREVNIDRNYMISLFKEEKKLEEVINELIDINKAPKWINKQELIYDIRRTFPQRFLQRKKNNDKKLSLFFLIDQDHKFHDILKFNPERYQDAKQYDQFNF